MQQILQEPWRSDPDACIPEEVSSDAPLPKPVNLFTRHKLPRLQLQPRLRQGRGRPAVMGGLFGRLMLGLFLCLQATHVAYAHLPVHVNNTNMLRFDCSKPKYIDAFDCQSFCNLGVPTPKPGHPTASYKVAQVVWVADTTGWVCHAMIPSHPTSVGCGGTRKRSLQ